MFGSRRSAALAATAATVAGLAVAALTLRSPAAAAAPSTGTTVRASVQDAGAQSPRGGGDSQISGNGRFDVFESTSALAPGWKDVGTCGCGDNPQPNNTIYVRDLVAKRTDIVSFGRTRTSAGFVAAPANNGSYFPSISADGRYVAFLTDATNVAGQDTSQIVVCDRGAPGSDGTFARAPAPGDPVAAGRCVEVGVTGTRTEDGYPHLSADASRIVWTSTPAESQVSNLYAVALTHNEDGSIVAPDPRGAQPIPQPAGGFPTTGRTSYIEPQISADGNWAVAEATDYNTYVDGIVEADLAANPVVVRRVDFAGYVKNTDGADLPSWVGDDDIPVDHPSVSSDGTTLAFDANYSPTFDQYPDVYVTTVDTGNFASAADSPAAKSFVESGAYASGTAQPGDGAFPTVSADGTYLAFVTDRAGMYTGTSGPLSDTSCLGEPYVDFVDLAPPTGTSTATRTVCQVVYRDLQHDEQLHAGGATVYPPAALVSVQNPLCGTKKDQVCAGTGASDHPVSLTADGSSVGFDSQAPDLVPGDTNAGTAGSQGGTDAFVSSWTTKVTASIPPFPKVAYGQDLTQELTVTDAGVGPFEPGGVTLAGPDATNFRVVGSTCFPTPPLHTGMSCVVDIDFTPSGKPTYAATAEVHDAQDDRVVATAPLVGTVTPPSPLPPGQTTRTSVSSTGAQAEAGAFDSMVSGNGRWDVFVSNSQLVGNGQSGARAVFVRDLADPQHTVQITLGAKVGTDLSKPSVPDGSAPNDDSVSPSISADGRFVSFLTAANNVIPRPPLDQNQRDNFTIGVCDRDPSGRRDAAGNLLLDQRLADGNPDYRCYAVQSTFASQQGWANVDAGSAYPRLSADGTHLTWSERDNNVEDEGPAAVSAWVATVSSPRGALHTPTGVTRVVVDPTSPGLQGYVDHYDDYGFQQPQLTSPTLTADGRHVIFTATIGFPGQADRETAIVENDLGSAPQASLRLDVDPTAGDGSGYLGDSVQVDEPATSYSGGEVAFSARQGQDSSVYVARIGTSAVTSTLESIDNDGRPGEGYTPALSGDGRYLAFVTDGSNMHDGVDGPLDNSCHDTDGGERRACQVVAKDLVAQSGNKLVTRSRTLDCLTSPSGPSSSPATSSSSSPAPPPPGTVCAGGGNSRNPSLDEIGSEIGFDSFADDLVAGDTNHYDDGPGSPEDAFVFTWRPTLDTTTVSFGKVGVGQHKDATITLTETGFGPVAPGATPITGPDAGDFSRTASTCATAVLHAVVPARSGNTCALTLRFTPKVKGARTADVAVDTRDGGYPRLDPLLVRTLTGTGVRATVTPPKLTEAPNPVDFGTPLPQDPTTRTVTITNSGGSTLTVTGATVHDGTVPGSSTDYSVDIAGCAAGVPPGKSCTIVVTFTGSAVGDRGGVLVITSGTGTTSSTTSIPVRATIAPPAVTTNPAVTPPGRVISVSGTGFGPNQPVDLTFTGMSSHVATTTDGTGAFTLDGFVLLPNGTLGPHALVARTSPSISATVQVLVVLGSVQGPILVTRR